VKRLADGLMAVLDDTADAVEAALEACERVRDVQVDHHRPSCARASTSGSRERLGSYYFGIDVNVAARVADAAGPGQVLVSETVRERLGDAEVSLRRHSHFKRRARLRV
jgi:adenylate cyclase